LVQVRVEAVRARAGGGEDSGGGACTNGAPHTGHTDSGVFSAGRAFRAAEQTFGCCGYVSCTVVVRRALTRGSDDSGGGEAGRADARHAGACCVLAAYAFVVARHDAVRGCARARQAGDITLLAIFLRRVIEVAAWASAIKPGARSTDRRLQAADTRTAIA
jgi:hypothetical protein